MCGGSGTRLPLSCEQIYYRPARPNHFQTGTGCVWDCAIFSTCEPTHVHPLPIPSAPGNSMSDALVPTHMEAPSAHVTLTRDDAPWAGLALSSISTDPPHDITRRNPGYHLRSSPWGRNLNQSCALVYSIHEDDPQDDRTPCRCTSRSSFQARRRRRSPFIASWPFVPLGTVGQYGGPRSEAGDCRRHGPRRRGTGRS